MSVASVSPSSGPTVGGTAIQVTGANFAPGATISVGGVPATNVTLIDATLLAATTSPATGGAVDVVVTSGGRTAVLPRSYTYIKQDNAPPAISAITAQGTRTNEPANYADLDEQIAITATVTDAETAPAQLTYEWSADAGSFIGTGAAVRWVAPHDIPRAPTTYPLTLTVTESYQTTDDAGAVVTKENKVTRSVPVHVHNTRKETGDLAGGFLIDFSSSAVSADTAVRNFSQDRACGRTQERNDIADNRATYTITASKLGGTEVTVNFGGACTVDRFKSVPGDACVQVSCGWTSTVKKAYTDPNGKTVPVGTISTVSGQCTMSQIYEPEQDRWQNCWSEFRGVGSQTAPTITSFSFKR